MNAVVQFEAKQIALIKQTVAKDANDDEFNLFIEMCKARGLNPLTRQVYCFIFNKENKNRQMTIVVSRDGQRSIAERTGAYRPDERAPRFEYSEADKNPETNPLGLVSAEVTVYKHAHGEWFPVPEVAHYDEYAPITEGGEGGFEWVDTGETWPDTGKPKKKKVPIGETVQMLDPGKPNWRKMPRIMLAKCAEMAALRKAFPDDFGGLYGEGELDRGEVLDLTPSEMAEKSAKENRLARIGGPDTYIIDWMDGGELMNVPGGKLADQVMAFVATCEGQPSAIKAFRDRNRTVLQQFWANHKSDALALRNHLDAAEKKAMEADVVGGQDAIAGEAA
jgi:phage recombination protein Bet